MPGARLNPHGRPVGSYGGFRRVAEIVLRIALDPENQKLIQTAMQKEFEENPAKFARRWILPATPHKDRKALREQIRKMEVAAYEKA